MHHDKYKYGVGHREKALNDGRRVMIIGYRAAAKYSIFGTLSFYSLAMLFFF